MSDLILCTDTEATILGYFTLEVAPHLLFYSYVPISILSIFLGVFALYKDQFSPRSKLLFLISLFFSIFLINEIILWTAIPAGLIHFSWSLSLLLQASIYSLLLLFAYVFTHHHYPRFLQVLAVATLLSPIIIFAPTKLNVAYINISECVAINGILWYYLYTLQVGALLFVLYLTVSYLRQSKDHFKEKGFVLLGSLILLVFIFISEFVGEVSGFYEINLVGPIGMLGFILLLTYAIVKYQIFNIKLIATQALIFSIISLIASQLFFVRNPINFLLTCVTLFFVIIASYFLVRSVKREIKQREEIQDLAGELAKANKRLQQLDKLKSEFVSIASHQLRSPLTSVLGYASMLKDGSYGKLPAKATEIAERIERSARLMGESVEDYLNISRIESGNMKYTLTDFNLKDEAEKVADAIRPVALKKNLVLLFRSTLTGKGTINADLGKVEQILHNLINNSMKYTEQGSISVIVRDDSATKRIYVDIVDTGIGMSEDTLGTIFQKFERGGNANQTNIHGTGLGLYTALKLAEAMGGTISAHSEGEGKGSRFTIEFPLVA